MKAFISRLFFPVPARRALPFRRPVLGLLFGLGLLLPAAAPAQTFDVVGTVVDEFTGEAIPNAEILYRSGKRVGATNARGRFEVTVNSRRAQLVFRRPTYRDLEIDLGEYQNLIDIELTMETAVQELSDVQVRERRPTTRTDFGSGSMEELESFQGMRIDLNDHLRQLQGVSGMGEFTNEISLYGGRTGDATHYLGQTRIPSLRHIDIGFPGNQSVLNPRLLRGISVEDNLARGPMNQGNSSALVYDLREGDPYKIRGDLVFGTVNRELNLNGYWAGRTFLLSGRLLEPTFLANLGEKFFTQPKDARLPSSGRVCDSSTACRNLEDPLYFQSGDLFFSTFKRDTSGAFSRHSAILVLDTFNIDQDVGKSREETKAWPINAGNQDARMYTYEALSPYASGDLQASAGILQRSRYDLVRDTLSESFAEVFNMPSPYAEDRPGVVANILGGNEWSDLRFFGSLFWNPNARLFGAQTGYGLELEYLRDTRTYLDVGTADGEAALDFLSANALWRLRYDLGGRRSLEGAAGVQLGVSGLSEKDEGEGAEALVPAPLASVRYTQPLASFLTGYGEVALRQNTVIESRRVGRIEPATTSSVEAKAGANGFFSDVLSYGGGAFTRIYREPQLPVPDVYWYFEETRKSDYALVNGANLIGAFKPSHHFGVNVNASVVQGDYYLKDGGALPWEANRTLDLVANFRYLPRNDSLLSFILTYAASNDAPLYEYGLRQTAADPAVRYRTVAQSVRHPAVSRQRTDLRINLDLASRWKPLEGMRLFFEADNLFAGFDEPYLAWLGGENRRRRGWTRANPEARLEPVVTQGLGFFIMFGFEGRLAF